MERENIDELKKSRAARAHFRYKLKNANVYVSQGGYHFTDYLDPVKEISPEINVFLLKKEESAYIVI